MTCHRQMLLATMWVCWGFFSANATDVGRTQPEHAAVITVAELKAGMRGEVWTVFKGVQPESFEVEVTGVVENALGPGKSMILCELTDERVQNMGAVAGMSGSPLYIDGKFAGALSYQVQRFETVRFAGFTPADDLLEVRRIALDLSTPKPGGTEIYPVVGSGRPPPRNLPSPDERMGISQSFTPLSPVFTFGGVSPLVATLMAEPLATLGLNTNSLGGSKAGGTASALQSRSLGPGDAIGAALAVGDITLAGTGTVSQVEENRVLAFGHPLLGLGTVEVPMTSAEIVTILPSNQNSFKIANTGDVIGTVHQDRLSAIYGELGTGPAMVPVTVHTPQRTLHFSTVRHPRLTPMITATGLAQAVLGSNDAGLTEGFRVVTEVEFPGGKSLKVAGLYAGSEGFKAGLASLVQNLSTWLQNPVEEVFPEDVIFSVEPLASNPTVSLDNVQVSQRTAHPGDTLIITLGLRDFQSQPLSEWVTIPVSSHWQGHELEVIVTNGEALDLLTGGQRTFPVSQIRDFDAYLDAIRAQRKTDGLYVAIVTKSEMFLDQTDSTLQLPDSFARIAQRADRARFTQKATREVLWERHILSDKLVPGLFRKPLVVSD